MLRLIGCKKSQIDLSIKEDGGCALRPINLHTINRKPKTVLKEVAFDQENPIVVRRGS